MTAPSTPAPDPSQWPPGNYEAISVRTRGAVESFDSADDAIAWLTGRSAFDQGFMTLRSVDTGQTYTYNAATQTWTQP